MNLYPINGASLRVDGLKELSGAGAATVRDTIRRSLTEMHRVLEIDLSEIAFIDSSGLGALISLHKTLVAGGGMLRLIKPSPVCLQLLELTRLHRILPIVNH